MPSCPLQPLGPCAKRRMGRDNERGGVLVKVDGVDSSALEHLLARAGFSSTTFFSSFDREPWTAGRETIVLARMSA